MKVKKYRGKGRTMTGDAHKRMAWKQRMARRNGTGGGGGGGDSGTKCFKCGGEGHWAKNCKGKGKINWGGGGGPAKKTANVQITEKAPVDEKEFPSLKAAAQMARGIKPTTTPAEVTDALHVFGFSSFRPGQETAIMRILCGACQSTLVMLSTGAGKSLCYQLPAYLYAKKRNSITLVISPLVSLMEDQVAGLPPNVKGACLHTNMSKAQRERIVEGLANNQYHLLLLSPEALISGGYQLRSDKIPPVAFACIDEVHCVSEWSHHFRPSYLRLCKVLKEQYGVQCMLGLTATATMVTAASVAQHLGISNYMEATIRGTPIPRNLCLSASKDEDKEEALVALLQGQRFSACDSIIVYCTRRQLTDRVSTLLRTCLKEEKPNEKATKKKPMLAECYHAGLSPAQRKRIQNAFMSGRLRIIVATVAFGMGLDKPDVRGVVHFNLPKTFESYVQEIGRAGRDGKLSHCHVFLDSGDLNELRRHVHANAVDHLAVKHLIKAFFPPCKCRHLHENHKKAVKSFKEQESVTERDTSSKSRICPGHEVAVPIEKLVEKLDMKEEGICTLLCYLELHPSEWLKNLSNVYAQCHIQCYGGPHQLLAIAKKCPPVAVAIARARRRGVTMSHCNELDFNVIEVADSMGWESGPVKRELKMLQWEFGVSGPTKTGVMVEFSDLGFHVRSPGDLSEDEVDEIVGFLTERMQTQERTELFQLQKFFDTLYKVSHKSCWSCAEKADEVRSAKLKENISEYFERPPDLAGGQVTMLSFATETNEGGISMLDSNVTCDNEAGVRADIRAFVHLYSSEHNLTGRSIARIFHGIPSPNFPADVWGRVRKFWRSHLGVDFNILRRLATQELVYMK
ncbi:hypothetical protein CAPTEDRAFT_176954 [Capitella teleta]|uniref:DNA 3'-5' helicase n=1 Tax=Capitella teleta TaxID=283909 RepID=R7VEJ9_CAPTE|nr:hypothetical protein CAPTEDRAFT_176954 [Capitella teleta]|eukprot:ELU14701.1 hypothetical protein CAPTEDRAFT_176954 [Capitella teleta]